MKGSNTLFGWLVSSLLAREVALFTFLFIGGHVVGHIEAGAYFSKAVVIPIMMGLFTGIGLRLFLGNDRDWSALPLVLVAGIAFSWVVSSAMFGSVGESVRISGFAFATLLGSILGRVWNIERELGDIQ